MNPPDFPTITGAHWAAMFRARRALGHYDGNSLIAQIRARIGARKFVGGLPTVNHTNVHTAAPGARRIYDSSASAGGVALSAEARVVQSPPPTLPLFPAGSSADRQRSGTPCAETAGGECFFR